MKLIDEQNDILGLGDFLHDPLEAFFEFSAILRSGNDRCEIEHEQPLSHEIARNLFGNDAFRETLDYGGLPDSGVADKNGIILVASRENLNDAPDFGFASDYGIELTVPAHRGKIAAVFRKKARGLLRLRFRRGTPFLAGNERSVAIRSQVLNHRTNFVDRNRFLLEELVHDALVFTDARKQNMLGTYVIMTKRPRFDRCRVEHAAKPSGRRNIAENDGPASRGKRLFKLKLERKQVYLEILQDGKTGAVRRMDESEHDMLGKELIGVRPFRLVLALYGKQFLRAL
jgi:hypothetical protein